jgi:2-polyprenyl-6-methoxyphenol hydroxylase-like FAD-dependent oxidoreductase
MRRLEKRWNHFEQQKEPLAGFLAVGDSAWAFNPLYGQGMSIGLTCARILRDVLRKDASLETLPRRYYREANRFAQPPWRAAALLDFAWPKTVGDRPWYADLARKAGHSLLRAAQFDDVLFLKLLRGAHLLAKPHEIMTPRVVFGLLRYWTQRLTGTLPKTDLARLPAPRGGKPEEAPLRKAA